MAWISQRTGEQSAATTAGSFIGTVNVPKLNTAAASPMRGTDSGPGESLSPPEPLSEVLSRRYSIARVNRPQSTFANALAVPKQQQQQQQLQQQQQQCALREHEAMLATAGPPPTRSL